MGMGDLPVPENKLLRVSDADREQVTEVLREAAGQGRITLDELDTRIDATYNAKTYAELEVITHDLPVAASGAASGSGSATLATTGSDAYPVERIGGTPKRSMSLAILSGA